MESDLKIIVGAGINNVWKQETFGSPELLDLALKDLVEVLEQPGAIDVLHEMEPAPSVTVFQSS
jgi:hypothetical protein